MLDLNPALAHRLIPSFLWFSDVIGRKWADEMRAIAIGRISKYNKVTFVRRSISGNIRSKCKGVKLVEDAASRKEIVIVMTTFKWTSEIADYTIGKHQSLVFECMEFFVPVVRNILSPSWMADPVDCAVKKSNAVLQGRTKTSDSIGIGHKLIWMKDSFLVAVKQMFPLFIKKPDHPAQIHLCHGGNTGEVVQEPQQMYKYIGSWCESA
ncbi:hypothetical protein EV361DRAFT_874683 [Lentinula raphanica]|nr:hypothetical protein EV361DRAFT_874683 [Lentinula raphanica]